MFQRLLPDSATGLSAADVVSGLDFAGRAPADRPWVALNMAATADGRVAIGGRSAPVAGSADRALFHELRTQADAVMAGAGTARVERYRRVVKDESYAARREAAGLDPRGLAILVSGALDLPPYLPVLADPESRVVIVTAARGSLDGVGAEVSYIRQPPDLSLAGALRSLRADYGVRSVLCEGGPHLNSALFHEDLVDELFLCVSPRIAGEPSEPAALEGLALPAPVDLSLVSLHEAEEHLFFRYRVRREG